MVSAETFMLQSFDIFNGSIRANNLWFDPVLSVYNGVFPNRRYSKFSKWHGAISWCNYYFANRIYVSVNYFYVKAKF